MVIDPPEPAKSVNMFDPQDSIPTRASLLGRLKDWDDDGSWQEFFDTYWRLIYAMALKSGLNEQEAQDVVQETVVSVAKKIHEFKSDPNRGRFKGWLLKLTRWRIIDQFRKRKPDQKFAGTVSNEGTRTATIHRVPDPESLDMDSMWEREWQRSLAEAALEIVKRRVKPKSYQIYDFHIIRGWTAPKVAKHLGVSMMNVYITAHRISKQLKQEVARLETKM